jgi:replicative DNA helicase
MVAKVLTSHRFLPTFADISMLSLTELRADGTPSKTKKKMERSEEEIKYAATNHASALATIGYESGLKGFDQANDWVDKAIQEAYIKSQGLKKSRNKK